MPEGRDTAAAREGPPIGPDAEAFRTFYETAPVALLVLAPDRPRFTILAASDAYLHATRTSRDVIGRGLFEVFPDDPDDPASTGSPARASLERVLATRAPDAMAVQQHSLRLPEAEGGGLEERYWSPINTPVLGSHGEVRYIHHRVDDVTELVRRERRGVEPHATAERLRTRVDALEADVLRRAQVIQATNAQLRTANELLAERDRERERRVDERIREGTALLQAISDTSPDVMFAKDRAGRVLFANPATLALIGKPVERVIGRTDAEFLDDAEAARQVMENDRRIMDSGIAEELEERVPLPDGSDRVWLSRKVPYRGRSGDVIGLLGVARDITDRKRATDALRTSEERLRAAHERLRVLVESTPLALVEWDSEFRVSGYSGRAQQMFGWSADEVMGRRIDEIPWIPAEDWPGVRAVMRDMSSGARPTNVHANRNLRKDGETISCEWYNSTLHDAGGRLVAVLSLVLDVTERERAMEALRAGEEKFRSVFEQAAIGMGRVRFSDARWIDVNDAFCGMLGRSRAEMLATPWPDITHPEDVDLDLDPFRRMAAGELESYTVEKRFIHVDGHHVWAKLTLSVVRDAAGRPECEIAIIEDIGGRKRAEEALRDADRRKDEFLGMLSHELRNPLAPIRNALYILDHARAGGQQARRAKDIAGRQVAHLTRLVDDLLDVTRIARGKIELRREDLDLVALAWRTAEDYRPLMQDRGVDLAVDLPPAPLIVHGDPARLTQILGNLLNNAAKFTPAGGRVTLSTRQEGARVVVHVRDTGPGIAHDVLPTIFEPFTQAKQTLARSEGGLGLGLSLVKGLIALHGGEVDVSSREGQGADFVVSLPLVAATAASTRAGGRSPRQEAATGRRRVLVVDDNRDAAESLGELVRILGHEVELAYDGPTAVALARERRPEVVLCDLGLPGMDGYQVAQALRAAQDGALHLVALSGYAQPEDVARALASGFDEHIAKPPDPEKIEQLLASPGARRADAAHAAPADGP